MNFKKSNISKISAKLMTGILAASSIVNMSNGVSIATEDSTAEKSSPEQNSEKQYVESLIKDFKIEKKEDLLFLLGFFSGTRDAVLNQDKNNDTPLSKIDSPKLNSFQSKIVNHLCDDLLKRTTEKQETLIKKLTNLYNSVEDILNTKYPDWKSLVPSDQSKKTNSLKTK